MALSEVCSVMKLERLCRTIDSLVVRGGKKGHRPINQHHKAGSAVIHSSIEKLVNYGDHMELQINNKEANADISVE